MEGHFVVAQGQRIFTVQTPKACAFLWYDLPSQLTDQVPIGVQLATLSLMYEQKRG